jgi:UDP-glucose 4-epimerase
VQKLLEAVEHAFQRPVKAVIHPIREGDPPKLVADNSYLRTWFKRSFSTLREVIDRMASSVTR